MFLLLYLKKLLFNNTPTPEGLEKHESGRQIITEASYTVIEEERPHGKKAVRLFNIINKRFGWAIARWRWEYETEFIRFEIQTKYPFVSLTIRQWLSFGEVGNNGGSLLTFAIKV